MWAGLFFPLDFVFGGDPGGRAGGKLSSPFLILNRLLWLVVTIPPIFLGDSIRQLSHPLAVSLPFLMSRVRLPLQLWEFSFACTPSLLPTEFSSVPLCSVLLSSTEKSIFLLLLLQIVLGRNGNGYSMCLHGVCGTDGLETGVGIGQQGRQQWSSRADARQQIQELRQHLVSDWKNL